MFTAAPTLPLWRAARYCAGIYYETEDGQTLPIVTCEPIWYQPAVYEVAAVVRYEYVITGTGVAI